MFKSRKAKENSTYNAKLKDICRATSAAPTYLPSYEMYFDAKNRILVDGGVYINNPALSAVADLIKNTGINIKDVECLSLGTGVHSETFGVKSEGWGMVNWVKPITTVMMQASSKSVVYECEQFLSKYHRVQVTIDDEKKSDMADSRPETTNYIIDITNKQVVNNKLEMKKIINFLK
jgi:patatin-like phospholipase/acyl hydrolase